MGKYDNYSNSKNIELAQKKLDKLRNKKKPDLYAIDLAQQELDTAKLFEHCQIFGSEGFRKSEHDPNARIMFSDDHQVMMFGDKLIHYKDIASCSIVRNTVQKSYTTTKKKGTLTRSLVGGVVAGGVGALVGAASAKSESTTTTFDSTEGFLFQVFLTDGRGYQISFPNIGVFSEKVPESWQQLARKVESIIQECKQ